MQIPQGIKKVAVLCVLKSASKFLLLRRLKEPNKDNYTPVGGKLDPYESPLQAAIRETWEETGIKVANMKFCGTLTETSPVNYNWVSFVYQTEIDFVPAPLCNEGTLEWIDFDELLNIPTPPTDWFVYQYLLEGKPFSFNAMYNAELKLIEMSEEISDEIVYKNPEA